MKGIQIKNLRDLIKAYGDHKSDLEISQMLSIPLDQVSKERSGLLSQSE